MDLPALLDWGEIFRMSKAYLMLLNILLTVLTTVTAYLSASPKRRGITAYYTGAALSFYSVCSLVVATLDYPVLNIPITLAFHFSVYGFAGLSAVMRDGGYSGISRFLICIPGAWFSTCVIYMVVFLPLAMVSKTLVGVLSISLSLYGLIQSFLVSKEVVDINLDDTFVEGLQRLRHGYKRTIGQGIALEEVLMDSDASDVDEKEEDLHKKPVRVVLISDIDIGPFMSPSQLRGYCQRAVDLKADLVAITGDFCTPIASRCKKLKYALEPLSEISNRVCVVAGNLDFYNNSFIQRVMTDLSFHYLSDDEVIITIPDGRQIQVLGSSFHTAEIPLNIRRLCKQYPPREEMLRILLSHDPDVFRHISPTKTVFGCDADGNTDRQARYIIEGDANCGVDLMLSGHCHGGQIGISSLFSVISALTSIPCRDLWARGMSRLYVSRGLGILGVPLRFGISPEFSILRVSYTSNRVL